ncbi:MAG TPA: hypothetical protein GXZ75_01460 [Clostridia bacterium]|nr:hypothetical protein [Clostridia bacterium]
MPYKLCPKCCQSSYSASDRGVWNCPYCGKDITFVPSTAEQPSKTNMFKKKIKPNHLKLL